MIEEEQIMKSLSKSDMSCVVDVWCCPECFSSLDPVTEQTEPTLNTTTATCPTCGMKFTVDHWDGEMLGGHSWEN
jgi:uncharacterized protein with PIN domain